MGCCSSTVDKKPCFHDSFQLGRKLGEGAFGQVRIARSRGNNSREYAVKIIDVRHVNAFDEVTSELNAERQKDTRQEISVWRQVGTHDNCVCLLDTFTETSLYYMVMEKCECSLMDKLVAMPTMTDADLSNAFRGMLQGISHVHSVGIVHRDIKPDNFLFGGSDVRTIKLCDFGLAERLPKRGKLKGCYGTAPYMSPEMISDAGYDEATDVWSFAAMAYLMIFGDFPYMPTEVSSPAMKKAILDGVPEPSFGRSTSSDARSASRVGFSDPATDFVKALLQRAPENRCTALKALELPFLSPKEVTEELPLKTNIKKARKRTKELKAPANPTVQRGMDELLQKLQERFGSSTAVNGGNVFFFSEQDGEEEEQPGDQQATEDRIVRGRSNCRHSTHSGTLSEKTNETNGRSPTFKGHGGGTPSTASDAGSNDSGNESGNSRQAKKKSIMDIPKQREPGVFWNL